MKTLIKIPVSSPSAKKIQYVFIDSSLIESVEHCEYGAMITTTSGRRHVTTVKVDTILHTIDACIDDLES